MKDIKLLATAVAAEGGFKPLISVNGQAVWTGSRVYSGHPKAVEAAEETAKRALQALFSSHEVIIDEPRL